jgi:hypothetical protein
MGGRGLLSHEGRLHADAVGETVVDEVAEELQ